MRYKLKWWKHHQKHRFLIVGGPFQASSPICSQCSKGVLDSCQNPNKKIKWCSTISATLDCRSGCILVAFTKFLDYGNSQSSNVLESHLMLYVEDNALPWYQYEELQIARNLTIHISIALRLETLTSFQLLVPFEEVN